MLIKPGNFQMLTVWGKLNGKWSIQTADLLVSFVVIVVELYIVKSKISLLRKSGIKALSSQQGFSDHLIALQSSPVAFLISFIFMKTLWLLDISCSLFVHCLSPLFTEVWVLSLTEGFVLIFFIPICLTPMRHSVKNV